MRASNTGKPERPELLSLIIGVFLDNVDKV